MRTFTLRIMPAVLCTLVACGRSPAPEEPAATASSGNPGSLLNSPKVAQSPRPLGGEPERSASIATAADPKVPLDHYTDLNAMPGGMALSYLVTAKTATPLSDDERLDRLSARYHSERDVFKRQEMAKTELPRVNSVLEEYRKQSYYSLPITSFSTQTLSLNNLTLGPYQAASRSFPLIGYGGRCWSSVVRSPQGVVLRLDGSSSACSLEVPDEAAARAIESARASGTLHLKGTAYVFIPMADKGTASGSVVAARIVLTGGSPENSLGNFDLRS